MSVVLSWWVGVISYTAVGNWYKWLSLTSPQKPLRLISLALGSGSLEVLLRSWFFSPPWLAPLPCCLSVLAGPMAHSFLGPLPYTCDPSDLTQSGLPTPALGPRLPNPNHQPGPPWIPGSYVSQSTQLSTTYLKLNIAIPISPHLLRNTFFPGAQQNSSVILVFWFALITTRLPSGVNLDDSSSETASSIHPSLSTTCQATTPISHLDHQWLPCLAYAPSPQSIHHSAPDYLCKMVSLSWLNSQRLHSIFFKNNLPLHRMAEPSVRWFLPGPQPCCPDCSPPAHVVTCTASSSGRRQALPPRILHGSLSTWSTHGSSLFSSCRKAHLLRVPLHQPGLQINLRHHYPSL